MSNSNITTTRPYGSSILTKNKFTCSTPNHMGHDLRKSAKRDYEPDEGDAPEQVELMEKTIENTRRNTPSLHVEVSSRLFAINLIGDRARSSSQLTAVNDTFNNAGGDFYWFVQQQNLPAMRTRMPVIKAQPQTQPRTQLRTRIDKKVRFNDHIDHRVFTEQQKCGARTSKY